MDEQRAARVIDLVALPQVHVLQRLDDVQHPPHVHLEAESAQKAPEHEEVGEEMRHRVCPGREAAETGEGGGRDWGVRKQSAERLFHAESTESSGAKAPTHSIARSARRWVAGLRPAHGSRGARFTSAHTIPAALVKPSVSRSMPRVARPTAGQGTLALCELCENSLRAFCSLS